MGGEHDFRASFLRASAAYLGVRDRGWERDGSVIGGGAGYRGIGAVIPVESLVGR